MKLYSLLRNNLFPLVLVVILFTACHKKAIVKSRTDNSPQITSAATASIKSVIIDTHYKSSDAISTFSIDSAKTNGNILSLFVHYSGGCKNHSFDLYSNKQYAKSLPPQTAVILAHTNNGDACRQIITKELSFDISELKYKGQNTVIVNLENKKRVYYNY